jgi:hypothetical protein
MQFPAETRVQELSHTARYLRMNQVPVRKGMTMAEARKRTGINHLTRRRYPCIELSASYKPAREKSSDLTRAQVIVANLREFLWREEEGVPAGFILREKLPATREERVDLALAIMLARLGPLVKTGNRMAPIAVAFFTPIKNVDLLDTRYIDRCVTYLLEELLTPDQMGGLTAYIAHCARGEQGPYSGEAQNRFAKMVADKLYAEPGMFKSNFLDAARETREFGFHRNRRDIAGAVERCYNLAMFPRSSF